MVISNNYLSMNYHSLFLTIQKIASLHKKRQFPVLYAEWDLSSFLIAGLLLFSVVFATATSWRMPDGCSFSL